MITLFKSIWRFLTADDPKVGEIYNHCDDEGNPWPKHELHIVEVKDKWVKIRQFSNNMNCGDRPIEISTFKLFYFKKP